MLIIVLTGTVHAVLNSEYNQPITGGNVMLDYIYRLITSFEQEHGVHPNLLYLNRIHSEHLIASFDQAYTQGQITERLKMEMIIDPEIMHPHVAWTQAAHRVAS